MGPTWVREVSHLNEQGHSSVCREGGASEPAGGAGDPAGVEDEQAGGAGELAGRAGEPAGGGQDQCETVLPLR